MPFMVAGFDMAKNAYLAKLEAERKAYFRAGLETGRQQIIDMMCCVLHDPDYMGKDTFGKDRLLKVVKGLGDYLDKFDPAFQASDEADYYQDLLDRHLVDCFGKGMADSFSVRYQYCLEYDYKKGRWK